MTALRLMGTAIIGVMLAASLLVTVRNWTHMAEQDRAAILASASIAHPLGTDGLGRDRLTRLGLATLLSLGCSCAAALASTFLAAAVGVAAGSSGHAVRVIVLSTCDLLTALPWIFLVMLVRGAMPLDIPPISMTLSTYLLLACFGWPVCARVVCGAVLSMKRAPWITQMRAQGVSELRLTSRHLAPNLRSTLLAQFLITVPAFLMAEVNLGLLGLGTAEPLPSWGGMLRDLEHYSAWTGARVELAPLLALVLMTGSLQLCLVEKGSR